MRQNHEKPESRTSSAREEQCALSPRGWGGAPHHFSSNARWNGQSVSGWSTTPPVNITIVCRIVAIHTHSLVSSICSTNKEARWEFFTCSLRCLWEQLRVCRTQEAPQPAFNRNDWTSRAGTLSAVLGLVMTVRRANSFHLRSSAKVYIGYYGKRLKKLQNKSKVPKWNACGNY